MYRDQTPKNNLGFGIPIHNQDDINPGLPNSGQPTFIQRILDGNPVAAFFTTATASIVSMHLAHKVAKHGGLRLAEKAQDIAGQPTQLGRMVESSITTFRKIQSELDSLQGLNREYVNPLDRNTLVRRDPETGRLIGDRTNLVDGFHFRNDNPNAPKWLLRDEIQQRLIAQARRLPYELPAFYAADKFFLDPILGNDQNRKPVKWSNPVDVIGDFAYETTKNLAFNVLPFEGAVGVGSSIGRKLAMDLTFGSQSSPGMVSLKTTLELVGTDVTNLLNKTAKFSYQSMGAFSNMVNQASQNRTTFRQWVRQVGQATQPDDGTLSKGGYARRLHNAFKDNNHLRLSTLDAMPGPFRGMSTALKTFGQDYKELGRAFDNWQAVVSGRKRFSSFSMEEQFAIRQYAEKGGGTYLEQFARATHVYGRGGPTFPDGKKNPDWRNGEFYRLRAQDVYNNKLIDALADQTGLAREEAAKFIRLADRVTPYSGSKGVFPAGENLIERIQFGRRPSFAKNSTEWWNSVVQTANKHGLPFDKESININAFKQAVKRADIEFSDGAFRELMDKQITQEWNHLYGNLLPEFAGSAFTKALRQPFGDFANSRLGDDSVRAALVHRTASRLGIKVNDPAGNPLPINDLKRQIRASGGMDPDDPYKLRGFLIQQKDIAKPWQIGGANLFGLKAVTIQEATDNGYFSHNPVEVQREISYLVNHQTFAKTVAGRGGNLNMNITDIRNSARLGRVYTNASGNVIDLGRMRRGVVAGLDSLASDWQIPLLHFNPLQLGFYKKYQQMRNALPINFISANSLQVNSIAGTNSDFYAFVKTSTRGSKGRVIGMSTDKLTGEIQTRSIAGNFRQSLTNAATLSGRMAPLFFKEGSAPSSKTHEAGLTPGMSERKRKQAEFVARLRRSFDISTDQRDALIGGPNSLMRRYRAANRKKGSFWESTQNPYRLASNLSDPNYIDTVSEDDLVKGVDHLVKELRNYRLSPKVIRLLEDMDFRILRDEAQQPVSLSRITDAALPEYIKEHLEKDRNGLLRVLRGPAQSTVRRSQNILTGLLRQGDQQTGWWDITAADSAKTSSINRRIDQLRGEFANYLVSTAGFKASADQPFETSVSQLLAGIEEMFKRGSISRIERSEARTAILSLQVEHALNSSYSQFTDGSLEFTRHKLNLTAIKDLLNPRGIYKDVHALLGEFGSLQSSSGGTVRKLFRRASMTNPYEIADEVNPFGSDIVFEPTFKTAFLNNRRKAVLGAAGLSWDQDAFSGASVVSSHMVMRLNKYFESVGLGIDPRQYRSPVDLFARGMVGKRILPITAAGTTAYAIDAQLGGLVNEDAEGNPIYSPLVLGYGADILARAQITTAGLIPGGQTADEKEEELYYGQVPVRQGRWWMLGNQPFRGGRIQYFQPSWYQRFKAAGEYTPEMNQTPLEKLAFGYDFSPLRPLDPYRFERENSQTRPYPVSGDYFTGPWGPVTPFLNATVGRLLKPQRQLISNEELQQYMADYRQVGESGAYQAPINRMNMGYSQAAIGTGSANILYPAMGYAPPRGRASTEVRNRAEQIAAQYSAVAQSPGSYLGVYDALVPYGVPRVGGISPRVISNEPLQSYAGINNQSRQIGYRTQEMLGIYGFGAGTIREALGFGDIDMTPRAPMLEPASHGYSSGRGFWSLNLGGLGDLPMPVEGQFANLELSEVVRRFVPREPNADFINPIPNALSQQYPWLPGADYAINPVALGDPYQDKSNLYRLPGTGYERTNVVFGSETNMSLANIHQILGNVAPWSQQYKEVNRMVEQYELSELEQGLVQRTRRQVEAMNMRNEFSPYEYRYSSATEMVQHPARYAIGRGWEWLSHRDTFINQKLLPVRTALEDWEREHVYGATYPTWSSPIDSFIKPAIQRATQRDPITASLALGAAGAMFGKSAQARLAGSIVGGAIGMSASLYGQGHELITGERYIPMERRKELALEAHVDILSYIRSTVNASRAAQVGDMHTASYFAQQAKQTMYGADLNSTPEQLAMALPRRKREHFKAMLYAPEQEREDILSTASVLERRLYQAAWGMPVEELPDLNQYFEQHELPPPDSQFWDPNVSMDNIQIKLGQHLGLDMAQMGYYPQQIKEANLINPVYPAMFKGGSTDVYAQLQRLIYQNGGRGTIQVIPTPFPGTQVQLNAGVY